MIKLKLNDHINMQDIVNQIKGMNLKPGKYKISPYLKCHLTEKPLISSAGYDISVVEINDANDIFFSGRSPFSYPFKSQELTLVQNSIPAEYVKSDDFSKFMNPPEAESSNEDETKGKNSLKTSRMANLVSNILSEICKTTPFSSVKEYEDWLVTEVGLGRDELQILEELEIVPIPICSSSIIEGA